MSADHEDSPRMIYGVHPVQEWLAARPREIDRLLVVREAGGRLGRLIREARRFGIAVSHVPQPVLERRLGGRRNHQGVAAVVASAAYADADGIAAAAASRHDGLVVLLDGVTDPGNLGAIARSAAAAGAQGLLLATEGTAGLTSAALKASAGVLATLPVAREPRPPKRLATLRAAGVRAVLLDPRGASSWDEADLAGPLVVVAGGEERGVRPGTARECNIRVAIPLAAEVESLNVSVATGVLLFEVVRRRRAARGGP